MRKIDYELLFYDYLNCYINIFRPHPYDLNFARNQKNKKFLIGFFPIFNKKIDCSVDFSLTWVELNNSTIFLYFCNIFVSLVINFQ